MFHPICKLTQIVIPDIGYNSTKHGPWLQQYQYDKVSVTCQ